MKKKTKLPIEKFNKAVGAFLNEPRLSVAGGWSPVTKDDLTNLGTIIDLLLKMKFERDCDGDLPINYNIIDRTEFEPNHFFNIPYTRYRDPNYLESLEASLDVALFNLSIASEKVNTLVRLRRMQKEES